MTGIEYMLLHVQDPILYVIRKAYRQSKDKGKYRKYHACVNIVCVVYFSDSIGGLLYLRRCGVSVS